MRKDVKVEIPCVNLKIEPKDAKNTHTLTDEELKEIIEKLKKLGIKIEKQGG